jgi:hypothetical protein
MFGFRKALKGKNLRGFTAQAQQSRLKKACFFTRPAARPRRA